LFGYFLGQGCIRIPKDEPSLCVVSGQTTLKTVDISRRSIVEGIYRIRLSPEIQPLEAMDTWYSRVHSMASMSKATGALNTSVANEFHCVE
jgi:hypothetical protein